MVRQAHHDRLAMSLSKGKLMRLLPPNQVRGRNDNSSHFNIFKPFAIIGELAFYRHYGLMSSVFAKIRETPSGRYRRDLSISGWGEGT